MNISIHSYDNPKVTYWISQLQNLSDRNVFLSLNPPKGQSDITSFPRLSPSLSLSLPLSLSFSALSLRRSGPFHSLPGIHLEIYIYLTLISVDVVFVGICTGSEGPAGVTYETSFAHPVMDLKAFKAQETQSQHQGLQQVRT